MNLYRDLYGLSPIILRAFSMYGPRQVPKPGATTGVISIFIRKLLQDEDIVIYGDGSNKRDFMYIDDLVEAILRCLDPALKPDTFNIGTGHGTSMKELAEVLFDIIKPKTARITYKESLKGDVDNYSSIKKAKNILGYAPKVTLREGLANFVRWTSTTLKPPAS
jgi:UDP-glucose 4-epimerase